MYKKVLIGTMSRISWLNPYQIRLISIELVFIHNIPQKECFSPTGLVECENARASLRCFVVCQRRQSFEAEFSETMPSPNPILCGYFCPRQQFFHPYPLIFASTIFIFVFITNTTKSTSTFILPKIMSALDQSLDGNIPLSNYFLCVFRHHLLKTSQSWYP